ncbi:DedA family protein [Dactylosporangium sp. CA-233914]|uniref:DedA family protein n=1 Tax=Dactylosporangium sp. CA-233914 TaxID=3239934 RepID=UPI003D8D2149
MAWLTEVMTSVPPVLVYVIVAALVCAETAVLAGIPVPTLSSLLLMGFLCRAGDLNLWVALSVVVAAGVLGDHLGYWTGRRQGARLRNTVIGRRIGEQRWDRADGLIRRQGGRAALVGRFVTVVRTLVPQLCGVAGMRYGTFAVWNVFGVIGWAALEVLAGFAAGKSYEALSASFGHMTAGLGVLTLVGLAVVLGGRWLAHNPDPVSLGWRLLTGSAPVQSFAMRYRRLLDALAARFGPRRTTAVTLGAGFVLVLAGGWAMTKLTVLAVRLTELSALNGKVADWVAARQQWHAAGRAIAITSMTVTWLFLAGSLIAAVVVTLRRLRQRTSLLEALAALGPVIPLVVLDQAVRRAERPGAPTQFFSFEAVVTAAVVVLAWSVTRGAGRVRAAAVWAAATAGLLVLAAARIYIGWSAFSDTVASVLLGGFWAVATITVIRIRRAAPRPAQPAPGTALARPMDGARA